MSECVNCPRLQAEITRLENENQRLRFEVVRLKRIIDNAGALCAMVETEANAVLATNSPKGIWAWNKGKREAANRISPTLYY